MPTLQAALSRAIEQLNASHSNARLEGEVLVCHALKKPRSYLYTWPEKELSDQQNSIIEKLIEQRTQGTPIAYLTGTREFWSRDFHVTPDVLIPRPETELLVELALKFSGNHPRTLIDLGTGSGIIAITLAAERPHDQVAACEISQAALNIARDNAARLRVNNLTLYQSNWFQAIPPQTFDLIISNPPYIATTDPHLKHGDLIAEPRIALSAGGDGLNAFRTIAQQSKDRLKPNGRLLFEHGYDQAGPLSELLTALGYRSIDAYHDLSGHLRVTSAQL